MRQLSLLAGAALAVSLNAAAPASAATPNSSAAAQKATEEAKEVLIALEQRNGSNATGTVKLQKIGSTHTRIRVQIQNPTGHPLYLAVVPGSDCVEGRQSALASTIRLNNLNTSQVSETIVALPMTNLRSGQYVMQARDATTREQITQACARLNH